MHPLPSTTQGTCHHLYEINISAIREISNRHLILLCVRRWTGTNDVNLSIPWWRTLVGGKTTSSKVCPTSHLFVCCIESLNVVACQIGLLLWVFGQALRFASWLWSVMLSSTKRVQKAHLCPSQIMPPPKLSPQIELSWSLLALATLMG
jgi:hypothetical protein